MSRRGPEPGTAKAGPVAIPPHPKHGQAEAVYVYHDAAGEPLFYVCRFKTPRGKTFLQGRATANGWKWNLQGVEPTLYRLPDVLAHLEANEEHAPLYIVEGEKDVHALLDHLRKHEAPGTATTNPMGAGKWRESYTEALAGLRYAVIVCDNDELGRRHALQVADELRTIGVGRIELRRPALDHEKADVSDHLAAGYSLAELEHLDAAPDAADLAEGPLLMDVADFARVQVESPPPLWGTHAEALLVEGGFAIFAGRPGTGKTTFVIDLACHLAAGMPYPPRDTANGKAPDPWPVPRPLRIALIENEGPLELFRDKVKTKLETFGFDTIAAAGGYLGVQVWRWGSFSFADDDAFAKAQLELDTAGIDLLIGDPLNMLGVEGVGSPSDTRDFIRRLRMLGMGVRRSFLMIHHFRERVEHHEDEMRKLSGAWSGHLDSLISLAQGGSEDEARLAFPKLRWARGPLPAPRILGRVYNVAGFEALGLEDDVAMLEPVLAAKLRELREAGDGYGDERGRGWFTSRNLAEKARKGKKPVDECLKAAPHLFTMRTGQAAVALGAKKTAKLWGLNEWDAEQPAGSDAAQTSLETVAGDEEVHL